MFEIGRICIKIAGRDAGKKCVIVEKINDTFVTIDGATRRKKVNVLHLEPLAQTVDIKAGANHEDVKAAFEKLGIKAWDKKSKKPADRPKKQRKQREKKTDKKNKSNTAILTFLASFMAHLLSSYEYEIIKYQNK